MARIQVAVPAVDDREPATMPKRSGPGHKKKAHGQDPWSVPRDRAMPTQSKFRVPLQTSPSCPPYKVEQHGAPISEAKECNTSIENANDDIALPTPINAALPCKLIAADGREEIIYTPIAGFEHLFQKRVASASTNTEAPLPTEVRKEGVPGVARNAQRLSFKKAITPQAFRRDALKRSRSGAYGIASSRHLTDDEDDNRNDIEPTITKVKTFRMGNFEGLREFLGRRLNELTMKPIRPIITQWIKLLEPKRLGEYGPYHKKRRCELGPGEEEEAFPPWWPEEVKYNEPAHLAKTDLINLAIDIILQHRSKDEIKRRGPWVAKLRRAANNALECTPSDVFSSSHDPYFNQLMSDRARDHVLPSLFDVAQSYEDYVFQNNLWDQDEAGHVPTGMPISWSPIERPPRQSVNRKRARKFLTQVPPKREDNMSSVVDSGDETEVDDTMINIAVKREQPCDVSVQNIPPRTAPVAAEEAPIRSHEEGSLKVNVAQNQQTHRLEATMDSTQSSFDQSMTDMTLREDVKCQSNGQPSCDAAALQHDVTSVQPLTRLPVEQIRFENKDASSFQTIQYNNPTVGEVAHFEGHSFHASPDPFAMFNTMYPVPTNHQQISSCLGMDSPAFSYPQNLEFPSMPMDLTPMPPTPHHPSYTGLPYVFNLDGPIQYQP